MPDEHFPFKGAIGSVTRMPISRVIQVLESAQVQLLADWVKAGRIETNANASATPVRFHDHMRATVHQVPGH